MASTRISAQLPPDIDPTKAPIAFGRRALPKLNEEIQSPEPLTQQRALMALCDLVHDPEKVYQAIQIGFVENLKTLLLHHDSTVRQKTTEILCIMAMHNVGRQGLIQKGVISALAELFDDPVDICRKNMHQVFEMMAKFPEGISIDDQCRMTNTVAYLEVTIQCCSKLKGEIAGNHRPFWYFLSTAPAGTAGAAGAVHGTWCSQKAEVTGNRTF